MTTFFIMAAAIIILVLIAIAAYLHYQLYIRDKRRHAASDAGVQQWQAPEAKKDVTHLGAADSIRHICHAVIETRVTHTEASIRINALSEAISLSDIQKEKISVFKQLAQATSHIPILNDWKNLPSAQKKVLSLERENIESTFHDFIVDSATYIVSEKLF